MMRNRLLLAFTLFGLVTNALAGAYEEAILAARDGRTAEIVALLQRGLDPNTTDTDGTTLLGMAVRGNNAPLVEALLAARASPNRRNQYGDNAVLFAANAGQVELLKRLHTAGGDLEPPGWTVLHYAVYGGHEAVVDFALAQNVDVNRKAPNQRTPLMFAAQAGNLAIARRLLNAGANTGIVDAEGKTAADLARAKNFASLADLIAGSAR